MMHVAVMFAQAWAEPCYSQRSSEAVFLVEDISLLAHHPASFFFFF